MNLEISQEFDNGDKKVEPWASHQNGEVELRIPSDAAVGEYDLAVSFTDGTQTKISVVVLFNPFSSKDDTYLRGKKNQEEYILGTETLIWQGTIEENEPHRWAVDQFEWPSLKASLGLLRNLGYADRASPAAVARELSFMVGSEVCYGKWGGGSYTSGKPSGGYRCKANATHTCTDPGEWEGTTPILRQYAALRAMAVPSSVQFCQCFVFAGVLTTISRALGIGARPTTTFQSAHDTNNNGAIERFFEIDSTGMFLPDDDAAPFENVHDSVWSFHVWTEMYMRRPDVGKQANGWQAVDATPQEESGGRFQMGPASVKMVKKGTVEGQHFDLAFVHSEVDADVNLWTKNAGEPDSAYTLYDTLPFDPFDSFATIGQQISTKARGKFALDDITKYYKTKEESPATELLQEERRKSTRLPLAGDVLMTLEVPKGLRMGADAHASVVVRNRGAETRTVTGEAYWHVDDYNSAEKSAAVLDTKRFTLTVAAGASQRVPLAALAAEYAQYVDSEDYSELRFVATGITDARQVLTHRVKRVLHTDRRRRRAVALEEFVEVAYDEADGLPLDE